jgi:hypothetical protein
MVETFIIVIGTLLITPSGLTIHLSTILKVIEVGLLIFNLMYFIVRIIITVTLAPPSTNISCNINPLNYTSMIGSHSCSIVMAFKSVGTFGTLGVTTPFLVPFQLTTPLPPTI